jgi:hypothetical protein
LAGRWIPVARQDYVGPHLNSAGDGRFEIVDLKPEQNTIAIRLVGRIANATVMVVDIEAM